MTAAFDLLDVTVEDLPAYTPHLKGTVEGLNRAVESMFLAALPGYARQPRPGKRPSRPKDEVPLGFEDFTARLPAWTPWWNTEHCPAPLRVRTLIEAWQDDPTPLRDVSAADLWRFTLEDSGTRTLTTRGDRFKRRDYVGPWMSGQAGIQVWVRFMPHHDHRPLSVRFHPLASRFFPNSTGPSSVECMMRTPAIGPSSKRGLPRGLNSLVTSLNSRSSSGGFRPAQRGRNAWVALAPRRWRVSTRPPREVVEAGTWNWTVSSWPSSFRPCGTSPPDA
ncbi:hypothetical protein AB0G85_32910 [Streptomyces sioyaensis]